MSNVRELREVVLAAMARGESFEAFQAAALAWGDTHAGAYAPSANSDAGDQDLGDFWALSAVGRESATRRVGRLGTLVVESIANATEVLKPLRLELAQALEHAGDWRDARKRVTAVKRQFLKSQSIADALYIPIALANMAGQLMVYNHEAPHVKPEARTIRMGIGDAQDTRAFLNKPWREAIDWFRERGVVNEDELSTLLQNYADQSVEARKLMLERVQARTYELLSDALEQGQTYPEFAAQLREDAPGLGITADDPAYLRTVFNTNLASAYGAGRLQAMNDPDVVEARPYRQIRTAGDARVRDGEHGGEDHVQLDGLVLKADGPLSELQTPFSYNCRCGIVSLASWDGDVIDEMPPDSVHEGFG
jgi:hypothetical protein